MTIKEFRGENYFLSNFYRHPVHLGDDVYPTAEHAYQGLKANNPEDRAWVAGAATPSEAKQRGRKVRMVDYWDDVRDRVMAQVLAAKFTDPELARLLVATDPHTLVEGNTWHDNYWGDCVCALCDKKKGKNVLGVTLMALRDKLRVLRDHPGDRS